MKTISLLKEFGSHYLRGDPHCHLVFWRQGLTTLLRMALNLQSSCERLWSSWEYRCKPQCLATFPCIWKLIINMSLWYNGESFLTDLTCDASLNSAFITISWNIYTFKNTFFEVQGVLHTALAVIHRSEYFLWWRLNALCSAQNILLVIDLEADKLSCWLEQVTTNCLL